MLKRIYFNLLQNYFKIGSTIAPKYMGDRAFQLFQKVRIKKIRPRELPFYEFFDLEIIPHNIAPIHTYKSRGKSFEKYVFLIHGMDSNPGSLFLIAREIEKIGLGVLALNLPSHGKATGTHTNIVECVEVFNKVIKHQEIAPEYLISHSYGSAVSAYALAKSDHHMEKMIFLSTPEAVSDVFDDFRKLIPIRDQSLQRMIEKAEEISGESFDQWSVIEKLKKSNFKDLTLIHDQKDKALPFRNSERIHESFDGSVLIPINEIGHYKMLWNEKVIELVISELKEYI